MGVGTSRITKNERKWRPECLVGGNTARNDMLLAKSAELNELEGVGQ